MTGILAAITAALTAYSSWVRWQLETETDEIEDEIDRLAADGSPAAKLRIQRLAQRLRKKRESIGTLRPANSDSPAPKAIPVPGGDIDGQGSEIP
jgi:hypothetical protein